MAEMLAAGAPLATARAAAILVHGRGGSAEDILTLADEFGQDDIAYLAPQAAGRSWYPYSFLAPLEQNEPHLSNALATVGSTLDRVLREGFTSERVALIGFSQGGCLALEYVARNAKRYGAVAGLSAGLIGPPGTPRDYVGSLAGTPVFLGCSDVDSHVPLWRVQESRDVLGRMGAAVTERIYPGMGHTVNADEIAHVGKLLAAITRDAAPRGEASRRS
jgi:predicted esterase